MDVLLTCVGLSDPYHNFTGKEIPGPILTLVEERRFDAVELFWTPGDVMNKYAANTLKALIRSGFEESSISLNKLMVDDPADFVAVLDAMRDECLMVCKKYESIGARYYAHVSSGTPQMGWAWIVLVQSGVLPARLIALRPRYIIGIERPYSYELDLQAIGLGICTDEADRLRTENESLLAEVSRLRTENEALRAAIGGCVSVGEVPEGFRLADYLEQEKRRLYGIALSRYPENASAAARLLGVAPHTFRKEAARLGLRSRRRAKRPGY